MRLRHLEQQVRGRMVPIVLADPRLDREGQTWLIDRTWNQYSESVAMPEALAPAGGHAARLQWWHAGVAYPNPVPPMDDPSPNQWSLYWNVAGAALYDLLQIGHHGPVLSGEYETEYVMWSYLRFPVSLPAYATVSSARVKLFAQQIGAMTTYTVRGGNLAKIAGIDWDDALPQAPYDWHHPVHNYKAWLDLSGAWKYYPWTPGDEDPYANIPVGGEISWDCGGTYTRYEPFYTCDIAPLVQEFILRPGYVPGNYLGLRVGGQYATRWTKSISADQQHINAFGGHGESYDPVLQISYGYGPEIRSQVRGVKQSLLMEVT